jgi:hypothetical protein
VNAVCACDGRSRPRPRAHRDRARPDCESPKFESRLD